MNFQPSQSSVLMSRSVTERVAAAVGEASRAALNAFQATWRDQAAQLDKANAFELMADIDERTLKDIGAPNWLIAQAIERKDARQLHFLELYRS